jgi:hypothetical protein
MIQIFDNAWVDAELIRGVRCEKSLQTASWIVFVDLDNNKSMRDFFTTEKEARRRMNNIAKKVKNATAEAEKHELRFYK